MRQVPRPGSGQQTRRCFTLALEHDSPNWIARFYLTLSLCEEEDGEPATALRHFQILDEVIGRVTHDPGLPAARARHAGGPTVASTAALPQPESPNPCVA